MVGLIPSTTINLIILESGRNSEEWEIENALFTQKIKRTDIENQEQNILTLTLGKILEQISERM